MRILFLCLSLLLSTDSFAVSKAYRGGDIGIILKQNSACFFVPTSNLSGHYQLNIFEQTNFRKIATFDNIFENRYPNENNCIAVPQNILKSRIIYTAVLDTAKTSFGSDFCLIGVNAKTQIGHYNGANCFVPELSWFDRFLNYFK